MGLLLSVWTEASQLCFHGAAQVTGEEEIPEGVVGVLTPDAPDVLSHVSVRARNMHVLFATCHDKEPLDQLKEMRWASGPSRWRVQVFVLAFWKPGHLVAGRHGHMTHT